MWKKIAIALLLLATAGAVGAYVLWRQATAMPDWVDAAIEEQSEAADPDAPLEWEAETEADNELPPEVAEALEEHLPPEPAVDAPAGTPRPSPNAKPKPKPKRKRKAKRYVLKGFHRKGRGKGKTAVRASRAVLEDGRLEAGVVLDLSRLEDAGLSETDRSVYDNAIKAFPALASRNVYVGIEDRPVRKGKVLQLGPKPKLRVGNLRYDLAKAAAKLDMSEAQLRRSFNRQLRSLGFEAPPQ